MKRSGILDLNKSSTNSVNYSKLKNNTYIVGNSKMPGSKMPSMANNSKPASKLTGKVMDDVVPEELEKKKKKTELNESTYYSTRGTHGAPGEDEMNTSYFSRLKNNV